jgi:opine dehydrogenase
LPLGPPFFRQQIGKSLFAFVFSAFLSENFRKSYEVIFMDIAVLGAGPGALALAACLALKGYGVKLYEMPEFQKNIEELSVKKNVVIDGYVKGNGRLALVTTIPDVVLEEVSFVFIVTHAAAHSLLAARFAPFLKNGQTVLLFPGYVGGAISFEKELKKHNPNLEINILESSALPFACRKVAPCSVFIGGWKTDFLLSAQNVNVEIPPVTALFGPIRLGSNQVETGLNETNFIIHACISLLNIGLLESARDWTFYREGLTPAVGRLIEDADMERLALLKKLGLAQISLAQWFLRFYGTQGAKGETVYDILKNFGYFATSKGPSSFTHRYFSEDIPYGLVPMAALGEAHGVPMPVANMLIDLAWRLSGVDYRSTGRKLIRETEYGAMKEL